MYNPFFTALSAIFLISLCAGFHVLCLSAKQEKPFRMFGYCLGSFTVLVSLVFFMLSLTAYLMGYLQYKKILQLRATQGKAPSSFKAPASKGMGK